MKVTEEIVRPVSRMLENKGRREVEKLTNKLGHFEVQYIPVTDLRVNEYNPNRQSDREFNLLRMSMLEHGFTQPIVVNKDNIIVDGEHRWRVASSLGYEKIPVVYVDMDEIQMRVATLRHNRARGSEDVELSTSVLRDLQELGALGRAMDSLLLDEEYVNLLLDDVTAPQDLAGDEYNFGWEPTVEEVGTGETGHSAGWVTYGQASSEGAEERIRSFEAQVEEEQNTPGKTILRREMQQGMYRISCVFGGRDAQIVRDVLGATPAERLLEICQEGT